MNANSTLGFGRWASTPIGKIPASYLLWLNEQEWVMKTKPLLKKWLVLNSDELNRRALQEQRDRKKYTNWLTR